MSFCKFSLNQCFGQGATIIKMDGGEEATPNSIQVNLAAIKELAVSMTNMNKQAEASSEPHVRLNHLLEMWILDENVLTWDATRSNQPGIGYCPQ